MHAICEVRIASERHLTLDIPREFLGQQVEIIILPLTEQPSPEPPKADMLGCLQQYANPALWEKEQDAWLDAVSDDDVSR